MTEIFPSLRKQNGSNDIVNVYSLNDSGIPISAEANRTMLDSARCHRDVDVTEAMSFTHCQKINTYRDKPTICIPEEEYQTHYNKTVGPLTKNKSIPDGSIIVDNKVNLLSVFRLTKINEGYIFRKIEKLFYVAYHEYDESTSLFYSKYPNEKIDEIILHFYIWLPDVIKVNKVKNILKKVYRKTVDKIPQFLKIQYNIFQTFGSKMKRYCWLIYDNVYMYGSYYGETCKCKDKKLKRIKDIEDVLILFFNNEIIEHIFADTFLNETLLDDSFFYV